MILCRVFSLSSYRTSINNQELTQGEMKTIKESNYQVVVLLLDLPMLPRKVR